MSPAIAGAADFDRCAQAKHVDGNWARTRQRVRWALAAPGHGQQARAGEVLLCSAPRQTQRGLSQCAGPHVSLGPQAALSWSRLWFPGFGGGLRCAEPPAAAAAVIGMQITAGRSAAAHVNSSGRCLSRALPIFSHKYNGVVRDHLNCPCVSGREKICNMQTQFVIGSQ